VASKGLAPVPDPKTRPTLTVAEAGAYLSISRASAYAAAHRGEIPTIRCGRRLLVPTAVLRRLVGLDEATPA
jgi:excisionase family DNA binding protein